MHFMNTRACPAHLPYWEKPKYIHQSRINSIPVYNDSALTQLTQRAGRRVLPLCVLFIPDSRILAGPRSALKTVCHQKPISTFLEGETLLLLSCRIVSVCFLHLPLLYHPISIAHLDCSWGVAIHVVWTTLVMCLYPA